MRSMLRALPAVAITGMLMAGNITITAAQEPADEATSLAARCEANAPDEETLAECLVVVHGVLERDTPAVTPTPTSDFNDAVGAVLGTTWTQGGKWLPTDPASGQILKTNKKKVAGRARKIAGEMADQLRAFLVDTTPDTCSLGAYSAAWDLVGSLRSYEDGSKGAAKSVGQEIKHLSNARSKAQGCAVGEGQPGALKVQQANEVFVGLLDAKLIDASFDGTLTITSKGKKFSGDAEAPETMESDAARDFLISLWESYQQAQDS